MRAFILTSVVATAVLAVGAASAQEPSQGPAAPTGIAEAAVEDVLTWEELPAALRQRADRLIGRPAAQAVLNVEAAITPDADFRTVDHGDILFEQNIRPAALARITRPVRNAEKYGPLGAALWPGVGPDGDYWCWRRFNPANNFARGNIYCYEDKDQDGVSERMMENNLWMGPLAPSRFQFLTFGHDEGVDESASFAVEPDALGEFREIVVLRYYGATRGSARPDGTFGPGVIEFELLTGPDRQALGEVSRIRISVDADGRGEHRALNGVRLLVDGVNVDGTARVKLLGALPAGRTLLIPPLTREVVLERMSEVFNPDGTPRQTEPVVDADRPVPPAAQ